MYFNMKKRKEKEKVKKKEFYKKLKNIWIFALKNGHNYSAGSNDEFWLRY